MVLLMFYSRQLLVFHSFLHIVSFFFGSKAKPHNPITFKEPFERCCFPLLVYFSFLVVMNNDILFVSSFLIVYLYDVLPSMRHYFQQIKSLLQSGGIGSIRSVFLLVCSNINRCVTVSSSHPSFVESPALAKHLEIFSCVLTEVRTQIASAIYTVGYRHILGQNPATNWLFL